MPSALERVLDVLRVALLVGAAVTLVFGPREQSLRLFLTYLVVSVARRVRAPRALEALFVLGMSFQAWGNVFGAFDHISFYDKIVHFTLPAGASPLLYLVLVRARLVPDVAHTRGLHQRLGVVLLTVALGLTAGGGLYELYESFADSTLGAHLLVGYGDSIGDLVDDTLGSLLGGMLVAAWSLHGRRRRRAPGDGTTPPPDGVTGRPGRGARYALAFAIVALGFVAGVEAAGGQAAPAALRPVAHGLVALAAAIVLYVLLVRLRVVPDMHGAPNLHQRAAMLLVAFAFGFSAGIWQEIALFAVTAVSGADAGGYHQLIVRLLADAGGALAGAGVVLAWDRLGRSASAAAALM